MSLFKRRKGDEEDNLFKQTGRGIINVGTVVGAGILCGMGFSAFQDAAEGN